ncbi:hypothetical protein E3T24_13105 [Cryobacterium sp. TmT2-59]|uniref:hypothetical protein n=1 Tax=Cryobacterium sp. TmT2-59 TaxID=1259264 RepID=UPI00106D3208|nr:hypothetical protein [Cryobacterium sp. TmT2-59]TFC82471.1 hypothetical protein E3T24_13105 [Cryobacterium sp. TmT2-59]
MPSFRITLIIGALRPGVTPDSVLPGMTAAAAELTTVEASDLAVVAGSARATVRFTANDTGMALRVGRQVVAATQARAEPLSWQVTERVKARWYPVR